MRLRDDQRYDFVPAAIRNFSIDIPERFNWGFDVMDRWGETRPDSLALLHVDGAGNAERYTFRDVMERSNQMANLLAKSGLSKGDPVLLMLPNVPLLWTLIVALIKVGAIIVPTASALTEKDLEYRIRAAKATGVITDLEYAGKFSSLIPRNRAQLTFLGLAATTAAEIKGADGLEELGWQDLRSANGESKTLSPAPSLGAASSHATKADDTCLIYFTSGTEGLPKMVCHTHASYPIGHRGTALWLGLREGDLHWNISSPGWAKHAWSSVFAPWNVGAATFSHSAAGPFSAARHLQKVGEFGINSLCAPPTVWRMVLLEELSKYDLSSLKSAASAGEPLNPEVIERFRKATGITIRDGYGQTETVLALGNFPGVPIRPGSMGIPSPLYDIDVVDDDGRVLDPDDEGNIAIRVSPVRPVALLKEYRDDPARNAEAFRNGWYFTGDRARKDSHGYFWYVGRADDIIKSSGYRIGPFEVESALIRHPAVVEAAVIAAPDEVRGAIVKAFVVIRPQYAPSQALADELVAFVAKETAPYKHPRRIEFVKSLDPVKTISGKTRRKALRQAEYGKEERQVKGEEFEPKQLRGGVS